MNIEIKKARELVSKISKLPRQEKLEVDAKK